MRLFMESLRDGRLSGDQQTQVISLLGGEIDRLETLVGRLLELSRIETGRHAFARAPVDVGRVITEALSSFDAATLSRPTKIEVDVEPDLTMIGDHATLVRAVVNLLVNAWKYSDEDKRIEVIARSVGRYVEITVRDNGIGISAGEQRDIFEEFHRAAEARDRGAPGVGLGLAFVRAIARAHKGKVVVMSRPGAGSSFTLRMKRGRLATAHPAAPAAGRTHAHASR
jgi:two-component system phosphate regulon sensor histidine kinase PhoR